MSPSISIAARHEVQGMGSHHLRFAKSGSQGSADWEVSSTSASGTMSDRGKDLYPGIGAGTNIRQGTRDAVDISMALVGPGAAGSTMSMWSSTVPLNLDRAGLTPTRDLDTFVTVRDTPGTVIRTFEDCYPVPIPVS
jgi:hypothetical protein